MESKLCWWRSGAVDKTRLSLGSAPRGAAHQCRAPFTPDPRRCASPMHTRSHLRCLSPFSAAPNSFYAACGVTLLLMHESSLSVDPQSVCLSLSICLCIYLPGTPFQLGLSPLPSYIFSRTSVVSIPQYSKKVLSGKQNSGFKYR